MRTLYNIFISRYFFGKFLGKFKFQFCSVLFSFLFVTVSFGQNSLSIDLFNTKESSFLRSSNSTDPNAKFIELDINETELNKLILSKPFELKFSIPTNLGTKKVQLTKVQIIASDFNIINEDGLNLNFDPILTYQGHIEGSSNNIATFIFNENAIEASLLMDEKTYLITSGKQNNIVQHIFIEEINEGKINNFTCGTSDESEVNLEKSAEVFDINVVEANASLSSKILNIHIECDNDLFVKSNRNVQILYKHIIRLFNSVNAIYRKEGIRISLSGLTIWQTKDPYTIGGGENNLDQLAKRYIKRPNSVDIVHLLSSRPLGDFDGKASFGGLANITNKWVDKTSIKSVNHTLCSDFPRKTTIGIECKLKFNPFKGHWRICDYQYKMNYFGPFSFSCDNEIVFEDIKWTEYTLKNSWTAANFLAHEIGHNLGSPHTHACRWNGNNTSIDNCYKPEGGCRLGPTPKKDGGTIMSYCHLKPTVGTLLSNGFGVQPGNLIRNTVSRAKCVEVAVESSLQLSTNKVLIGKNQGSFTVKLTANSQNVFWSSTVGANWLKLSKIAGQGSQDLVVQYDADNSNDVRSALITILTENNLQTITVVQGAADPVLKTLNYTELTATTCKMGGEVIYEGNLPIIAKGVVWSTSPNPTTSLPSKTNDGRGLGSYTSVLSGLKPNTTYYARAYVSNSTISFYGETIKFNYVDTCGAFIAPGVWAEFMCHNLGANDTSRDSFKILTTTGWEIVGNYWQWGQKNLAAPPDKTSLKFSGFSSNSGISNWNKVNATDIAWKDDLKSVNDPCPEGFRIPTINQWRGVMANNGLKSIGVAVAGFHYTSGLMVGNKLFLPAASYRSSLTGSYLNSSRGYYWSSSNELTNTTAQSMIFDFGGNINFSDIQKNSGASIRCISEKALNVLKPEVKIESVNIISFDSVSVKAMTISKGINSIKEKGIYWNTISSPNIFIPLLTTKISFGSDTGSFKAVITKLEPNTKYFLVAYVTDNISTYRSKEESFTTPSVLPKLETNEITIDGATTAIGGGSISSNGGNPILARGVVWGTSPLPTINLPTKTSDGSGSGTFKSTLNNLQLNTVYYVRAYATTSFGTGYGSERKFSTNSFPSVLTGKIDSIKTTSVRYSGTVTSDGGATITARGIVWDTCNNPTLSNFIDFKETVNNEARECCPPQFGTTSHNPNLTSGINPLDSNMVTTEAKKSKYEKAYILLPGHKEPQELTVEIRNGYVFWNGDIGLFTEEEYELNKLEKGNVHNVKSQQWPNGIIPYTIKSGHSDINTILSAIKEVNSKTNVCLVPRTNEENFIDFIDDEAGRCYVFGIGMRPGRNIVNVAQGCGTSGSIHEIFHKAGMYHEQSRNDRDQYINVIYENIATESISQFDKRGATIDPLGEYDYLSIMHYGRRFFSKNGQDVMTPKSPPALPGSLIPFYNYDITKGDIASINFMYPKKNCCNPVITTDGTGLGIYSGTLTGLKPGKTYYLKAYAKNNTGIAYGNLEQFTTLVNLPTVITLPVDSIKTTSAVSGGNITSDGGGSITARGFVWDTIDKLTINSVNKINVGAGLGSFKSSITNLNPGTKYYLRAFATNSAGTAFGEPIIFNTQELRLPLIKTLGVDSILATTALCAAAISDDGGSPVTSRGFVWDTIKNPLINLPSKILNGSGIGSFTSKITGLKPGTIYYFNSFATNSLGTVYAGEQIFTTAIAIPNTRTLPPVAVDGNSFITGGEITSDGGSPILSKGVVWDTLPNPAISLITKTNEGIGTGVFTSTITGLKAGKKYFFRSYATNKAGTGYGGDSTFVPTAVKPTVKTADVLSITGISAECGGVILSDGGANITSRGIVWSTSPLPTITLSTKTSDSIGVGSFKSKMSQLLSGNTYFVRAYATNNVGVNYGDEIKFTTLTLPNVLTLDVDSIAISSAIYNGNVTSDGGSEIIERGVVFDTLPNPTIQGINEGPITLPLSTYSYQTDSITTRETDVLCYGNLSKESRFEKISVLFKPTGTPQEITVEIKDGYVYYQHCIILFTEKEFELKKLEKGNIISINNYRWPNGIIPFIIDPSIKDSSQIFEAIEQINIYTNLCLKPRGTEINYVHFKGVESRCASAVGMSGGGQTIHAGPCSVGSIIHEILHAAGMYHEQSRPDRNNYIKINYENISDSYLHNFRIPDDIDVVGKYDYESIMHYGSHFFSKNSLPTIEVLSPPAPPGTKIGQGNNLSVGDIETINTIYTKKDCSSAKNLVNGKGKGFFSGKLTGLKPGTKYYIKAYAKNTAGISYGQDVSFTTPAFLPSISNRGVTFQYVYYDGFRPDYRILSDGGIRLNNVGLLVDTVPIPTLGQSKLEYSKFLFYYWNGGTGEVDISGLKSNTSYYYRFFATNKIGTAYSEVKEIVLPHVQLGGVKTISVDSIKANTGICSGNTFSTGKDNKAVMGFVWDTLKNPTFELSSKYIAPYNNIGNFFSIIEGLTPSTTYYIKAFIKNAAGISYGSELTFSTKAASLPPIVKSIEVKNVKSNSFEFIGEVTADNESTVYERGVVWDTTKTPLLNNSNKIKSGNGKGVYNTKVSTLNPNTTYYARSYALNSAGVAYGDVKELKTLQIQLPLVRTIFIERPGVDSFKVFGSVIDDGGAEVTYGIEWSTRNSLNEYKLEGSKIEGKGITSFSSVAKNLKPGTQYYVRVFGKNSAGISFGDYLSTSTKRIDPVFFTEIVSKLNNSMSFKLVIQTDGGWGKGGRKGVIIDTVPNAVPNLFNTIYSGRTVDDTSFVTAFDLKPNKKYFIRGFLDYGFKIFFSKEIIEFTLPELPKVITSEVSFVSATSAECGGDISYDGGLPVIERGVFYSANSFVDVLNSTKTLDGVGTGKFVSKLSGLKPGTYYFVTAYATNKYGTGYGFTKGFITLTTIPELTTIPFSKLTSNSVESGGNIVSNGGTLVTVKGVVWGTNSFPTITLTTKTLNGSGDGAFSSVVTGLLPNTKYFLRAYATNSNGTNYGSQIEFTTKTGLPELTTKKPTSITDSSAVCGGDIISIGNFNVTARGVVWSLSPTPTVALTTKTMDGSGAGSFTSQIKGLTAGRRYYVRAYATNSLGTDYGGEEIILTPIGLPIVTTTKPTTINSSSAISGGNIISTGGAAITSRGVIWGTSLNPNISLNTKTNNGTGSGVFSSSISGLNPATKYYVRAYATNSIGTSYGVSDSFTTVANSPSISALTLGIVNQEKAVFSARVLSDGGSPVTERGIVWSKAINPSIQTGSKKQVGSGIGEFFPEVSEFDPCNRYYFRAYATNAIGTVYSEPLIIEPSITRSVVDVYTESLGILSPTSALVKGEIWVHSCVNISAKGIVWSTNPNPVVSLSTKTNNGSGTGSFTATLTGLTPGVINYIRSYWTLNLANGISETVYGNQFGNAMPIPVTVPTVSFSGGYTVRTTSASFSGNVTATGGDDVTARGVVWGTSPNPTVALNTKTVNGSGLGIFSSEITNLTPCTRYYARAYATNIAGTGYASQDITWQFGEFSIGYGNISSISSNSASWTATLEGSNCVSVTQRGAVWSTSPNPTISLATKTENGSGLGSFTSNITGLVPNTTYHVRFYVTLQNDGSDVRTSYFGDRTFTTTAASQGVPCPGVPTVSDTDGNTYNTVQIGTQCWTKENLRVTKYNDGTVIPLDNSGGTAGNESGQTWGSRTTGARTIYEHSASNLTTYGYLYNWYAAKGINTSGSTSYKNLCPAGWHVPSDGEWTALTTFLGGESIAGGKMKSTGTTLWASPNTGATNVSGFTGLPGGFRNNDGRFLIISDRACFWGADDYASRRELYSNGGSVNSSTSSKSVGFSIRCLRDNSSSGLQPNEKTNLVFLDSFPTNTFYSKREVFEKEMNLEKAFIVFPNPSSGRVTVRFNNFKTNIPRKMEISDEMGRILREFNFSEMINQFDFDLTSLPGSVFFLKVYYDNGILVEKIFKQ
jgi:uncharacterized protein (TIGR02145 family)